MEIRLVAHDPAWGGRFTEEAAAIRAAIGPWLTGGVEHVGSTAVPGLAAKPVIDIMAGVADLDASRDCIEALAGLGYLYAPYRTDVMHWFCKPDPAARTHHLHLVPTGSPRWHQVLSFRDLLRRDPAAAAEYATLKRTLAARFPDDREAYTDGKAELITRLLAGGGSPQTP
ncbi:GrpB family protein [Dactylosporangium sp. NPDC049525]|uniref:GrpB family protein n=1 Tax=Dactylosporangium sp. NPDC049525 TaxID=3154730 RepID=UPI00343781F3